MRAAGAGSQAVARSSRAPRKRPPVGANARGDRAARAAGARVLPEGPEGAHQVRNDSDRGTRVLMWSTVVHPTVTAYPDSDKVGVYTGDRAEDLIVTRASAVGYFHGEIEQPPSD